MENTKKTDFFAKLEKVSKWFSFLAELVGSSKPIYDKHFKKTTEPSPEFRLVVEEPIKPGEDVG